MERRSIERTLPFHRQAIECSKELLTPGQGLSSDIRLSIPALQKFKVILEPPLPLSLSERDVRIELGQKGLTWLKRSLQHGHSPLGIGNIKEESPGVYRRWS